MGRYWTHGNYSWREEFLIRVEADFWGEDFLAGIISPRSVYAAHPFGISFEDEKIFISY
jgi:hypothetical protein